MAKKPADRFQNTAELVAAIDRVKGGPASLVDTARRQATPAGRRKLILGAAVAAVGAGLLVLLLATIFGPSAAERAFRLAGSAITDEEKIARYREIASRYPGTSWAEQAAAQSAAMTRALLDRELLAIKVAGLEGKVPHAELVSRLDRLRSSFPQGQKPIDAMELTLQRLRVEARTRAFGEALRTHKPEDKGERFKEFVAPEALKKVGEGWVMLALRILLGGMAGAGIRVEEVELLPDRTTVDRRKDALTAVKVVVFRGKARERLTQKFTIRWIGQEGDWYLADKGIQEEK